MGASAIVGGLRHAPERSPVDGGSRPLLETLANLGEFMNSSEPARVL
jgi:hypothetical protein